MNPDRRLVSVPYAYQAEKAREVSATGTVVKSIAGPDGTKLTDDVVFAREGEIGIRRDGNTITFVGRSGPVVAQDLACPASTPCVESAEISGPLTDALIPDLGTLSGVVADAQIDAAIARDSEVTAAVAAVAAAAAKDVACTTPCVSSAEISGPLTDALIPDLGTLSGGVTDGQIPAGIARDSEVAAAVAAVADAAAKDVACTTPCVSSAEISGPLTDALIPDLGTLSGGVTDGQIPAGIARDSEVPALVGPVVKSIASSGGTPLTNNIVLAGEGSIDVQQSGNTITIVGTTGTAAATDVACSTPCVSAAEMSGPLTDALIPPAIARDAEVEGAIATHTAIPAAHHAKTTSFTELTDTISSAQIPASITHDLNVNGTVTVVALAAKYQRIPAAGSVGPASTDTFSATCPAGTSVLGGGLDPGSATALAMVGSWPNADSWFVKVNNSDLLSSAAITVYAICAAIQ
jgi:hypothetical protein